MAKTDNKQFRLWFHIKGILVVTLIGASISLVFTGISSLSWRQIYLTAVYSFLIGSTLWIGNVSINPVLDRIFRNKPLSPGNKLVISLVLMILVSAIIILGVNWFFYDIVVGADFWQYFKRGGSILTMIIQMVVVIIIALVLYIEEFFHSWRESVKNEESLEREKLALQYEALKNQVNPHFLFNSLNTLSGLIGKDAERARMFVKQLSDIYRYILEQKDRELVPLETEMKFVENYISLMKIRFGENLQVIKKIPSGTNYHIIPLSIQMLVENAIKHNIISKEKPLNISIELNKRHLEVKNNLQQKSSILQGEARAWEKHGLANLKSRYTYLSDGQFMVNGSPGEPFPDELEGNFVVSVPLIRTTDEDTDR